MGDQAPSPYNGVAFPPFIQKSSTSSKLPVNVNIIRPSFYTNPTYHRPEWRDAFQRESGELFVSELVEQIVHKAAEQVYERYIQRKVVPYAVLQAKEAMLFITNVSVTSPTEHSLHALTTIVPTVFIF